MRTGSLLWFGAIVGLWTAASFVETIRDILRRAYGVKFCAPFWEYRIGSILLILGAVVLLMLAFAASAVLTISPPPADHAGSHSPKASGRPWALPPRPGGDAVRHLLPVVPCTDTRALSKAQLSQVAWALFITAWWLATVELFPDVLGLLGGYTRTYGSMAGVMIALIFFFVVGLGVVMGAELNAALAEAGATALKGEVYSGPYQDELDVEEPAAR